MDLRLYERSIFAYKLRPLLISSKCDKCSGINNLELHHNKQFSQMLNDALERLGLEFRDSINDYSKEELINITDMFLGIHISCKYTTLCEDCHIKLHGKGEMRKQYLRKKVRQKRKDNKKEQKGVKEFIILLEGLDYGKEYLLNELLYNINYNPKSFNRLWANKNVQEMSDKLGIKLIRIKNKNYLSLL